MSNFNEQEPTMGANDDDFKKLIAASWTGDDETETPSLAAAVDSLMAANAELQAKVAYYEDEAREARHAFRALKKAKDQATLTEAADAVRNHLRNIRC